MITTIKNPPVVGKVLMARKGVYLAGGDLIVCKNIPGFLLYLVKKVLSKWKKVWSKRKIVRPIRKKISKN